MRIEILDSARRHGITDGEIRAVVTYPEYRTPIAPRLPGSRPVLSIGSAGANEPHIEVIHDAVTSDLAVVFHAMMLRPVTALQSGATSHLTPNYSPQRPEE